MVDQRRVIIRNASILDPAEGEVTPDRTITVEGGDIVDVGDSPGSASDARQIDAAGRVVAEQLLGGLGHGCLVRVRAGPAGRGRTARKDRERPRAGNRRGVIRSCGRTTAQPGAAP